LLQSGSANIGIKLVQ
jgi:NAD(P)-dependent dehydrogenase (short-subunit alcohol dehydrogenase family)